MRKEKEIKNWLKKHTITDYHLRQHNNEILVDVKKSVNLNNFDITTIPFKFGIIDGDFDISNNFLKDCSSLPQIVHGDLNVAYNKITDFLNSNITTINGCGNFSYNQITSLEKIPTVLKELILNNNSILSLYGMPSYISSGLFISENQLTNLDYLPEFINGHFFAISNKISEFSSLQKSTIMGMLNLEYNNLKSCKNIPKVHESIFLNNNQITSLEYLPTLINGILSLNNNQITSLRFCPQFIKESLCLNYNLLTNFEHISQKVKNIYVHHNKINTFKGLENCEFDGLHCHDNKIKNLTYLPKHIKGNLALVNNEIDTLLDCPEIIDGDLDLSNNLLTNLQHISKVIHGYLRVSHNPLTDLKYLPKILEGDFLIQDCKFLNIEETIFSFDEIKKLQLYYQMKEAENPTLSVINYNKKMKI